MAIPEGFEELFKSDVFFSLVTLYPDGSPHLTPVWVDYDDEHVLVNTERGRQKEKNVRRDPRVALVGIDPEEPYRYISVEGEVVDVSEADAVANYQKLALRYTGEEDRYERMHAGKDEPRVILYIEPKNVITQE